MASPKPGRLPSVDDKCSSQTGCHKPEQASRRACSFQDTTAVRPDGLRAPCTTRCRSLASDPDGAMAERRRTPIGSVATRSAGHVSPSARSLRLAACLLCCLQVTLSFNLDLRTHVLHRQNRGTMFGFTVDQYREDRKDWLLVGAPESNSPFQRDVYKPGVVYKCPTTRGTCQQIVFDRTGHDIRYNGSHFIQFSNKTLQWFGATISSSSQHQYILSCAPRFVYFTSTGTKREPIGVCFLYRHTGGSNTITPYYPCKTESPSLAPEDGREQTHCEAGSAASIADADKIVIGAVGSFYWQGQVMIQDIHDKQFVIETRDSMGKEDDSYHGYAVAVGNFDGDTSPDIAASAPRLNNQGGVVKLYNRDLTVLKVLTGTGQIGEYFGYSLAVADFNSDGLDDIVVGAPFYADQSTNKYEMGHVYVFYQNRSHDFKMEVIEGDKETKARFGISVSSIGDVNDDGYNDLVVGAPYGGTDAVGAVYIFQGSHKGILGKYSQKINARDVSNSLMTFGYSVKGGMDQDGNEYPDLVVGAYESAEVVFFRARPVIKVKTDLMTSPNTVNLEKRDCKLKNGSVVSCFNLQTCFSYSGKSVPSSIDIEVKWLLDSYRNQDGRVYYLDGLDSDRRKEAIVRLRLGQRPVCHQSDIALKEAIQDKLSAIVIQVSYSLILSPPVPDVLQPILDYYTPTTVNTSVEIEKNCGQDEVCIPDLKLEVFSQTPQYAFGLRDELDLTVLVKNAAEESYETQFFLTLPPGVTYINIHKVQSKTTVSCTVQSSDEEVLVCNIGNPLPADRAVKFSVRMQPQNISHVTGRLLFDAVVNSTNPENDTDVYDNYMTAVITMTAVVDIVTTGVSIPEQVLFNSSATDLILTEEDVGPEFVHRYVVTNNGPSSLSSLTTDIYWPETLADGSLIFYLTQLPEVKQGHGYCTADIIDLRNVTNMVYNPDESGGILKSALRFMFGDKSNDQRGEKNFKINCAQGSYDYCKKIHCVSGPLDESDSLIIEVHSRVFINSMVSVLEAYRGVVITSLAHAEVTSLPYANITPNKSMSDNNTVETFVTAIGIGAGSSEIPWWVIALAIVGGALMLMLVVFCLWKCGFFKRKKLEDEEHLDKEEENTLMSTEANGKNGQAKPPPKVQVDPESKNLYKELPDDDF